MASKRGKDNDGVVADLFGARGAQARERTAPLPERMRPRTIDEVAGQRHLVGPGCLLRAMVEEGAAPSLILWGPPGTGKTTLARIVATACDRLLVTLSAVESGVKDIRRVVDEARQAWSYQGKGTVLFVDEIHRFNRAQQDVLLPHVEDGTFSFIGATTENPSFEVIGPLMSRCRLIVLEPLDADDVIAVLRRALSDQERGLGASPAGSERPGIDADDDALRLLATLADGDARTALNLLEWSAWGARKRAAVGGAHINEEDVREAAMRRLPRYDKSGEEHFNLVSALHKAIRGSDADAALYWLARMLEAGEDPIYVARRLVRMASEDIGNADPRSLMISVAAMQAVQLLGMPEGSLALAQAASWLALAPKSHAVYRAYGDAARDARDGPSHPVPPHLRNAPTKVMKDLGYGEGYRYAHDYRDAIVPQRFFPEEMEPKAYYHPHDDEMAGEERRLAQRRRFIEERKQQMEREGDLGRWRRPGGPGW